MMLFSASTFAYPSGSMGTPALPMRCARNVRTKSCCSAINCHATYRVVATPASGVATAFLTYDSTVLFWVIPALSMGYSFGFLSLAKFTLRIGSRIALSFGQILGGQDGLAQSYAICSKRLSATSDGLYNLSYGKSETGRIVHKYETSASRCLQGIVNSSVVVVA